MITLALIGAGAWGRNYIKTIEKIPACRLKYVCALSDKTLNALPHKYIKVKNYKDLYEHKDIEGVIIVTPAFTHFQIAKDFLNRGYNLLIEKPLTTSCQEALELKKIYDQVKTTVLVGHLDQYNPAYMVVKKLVKEIGKIRYLDFEGLGFGQFPNDVSVLWDWGGHAISLCCDVLEEEPKEIVAWAINALRPKTKLHDLVYILLKFNKRIVAHIKIGWLSPEKRRKLTVVGSDSSLVFDDIVSDKVIFFQNLGPTVLKNQITKNIFKVSYPSYSHEEPLKLQLLEFLHCIREKRTPKTDFLQGVQTIKIIHFAQQSILQGGKSIKARESFRS